MPYKEGQSSEPQEVNPENGLVFDPDKEITKEDLEHIMGRMKEVKEAGRWDDVLSMTANLKILFPNREVELDKDEIEATRKYVHACQNSPYIDAMATDWQEKDLKILDPSSEVEHKPNDMSFLLNEHKKRVELAEKYEHPYYAHTSWGRVAEQAMCMKIVNPEQRRNLDSANYDKIMAHAERARQDAVRAETEHGNPRAWEDFATVAAAVRVILPDRLVPIDGTMVQGMKNALKLEKEWPESYLSLATDIKIITAKKVTVPKGGGLEVEM